VKDFTLFPLLCLVGFEPISPISIIGVLPG
jgi:hypothetical protein